MSTQRFTAFHYNYRLPETGWTDLYFQFSKIDDLKNHILKNPSERKHARIVDTWDSTKIYDLKTGFTEACFEELSQIARQYPRPGSVNQEQAKAIRLLFDQNSDGASCFEEFNNRTRVTEDGKVTINWQQMTITVDKDGYTHN